MTERMTMKHDLTSARSIRVVKVTHAVARSRFRRSSMEITCKKARNVYRRI